MKKQTKIILIIVGALVVIGTILTLFTSLYKEVQYNKVESENGGTTYSYTWKNEKSITLDEKGIHISNHHGNDEDDGDENNHDKDHKMAQDVDHDTDFDSDDLHESETNNAKGIDSNNKVVDFDENIKNVEFSADACDFIIDESEDQYCYVESDSIKRVNVAANKDTITFSIKKDQNKKVNQKSIRIFLPSREYDSLKIEAGAGRVKVNPALTSKVINIAAGAGQIDITEIKADELNVAIGAGECEIHKVFIQKEASFSSGVGYINAVMTGKQEDYDCSLHCQTGEIVYGTSQCSGINKNTVIDHGKEKMIKAECGIGAVEIRFAD